MSIAPYAWAFAALIVGFIAGRATGPRVVGPIVPVQPVALPDDVRAQVESAIRSRKLIDAIKIYREATGQGLKESRDAVEAIQRSLT